jgi:hypothetical protein
VQADEDAQNGSLWRAAKPCGAGPLTPMSANPWFRLEAADQLAEYRLGNG